MSSSHQDTNSDTQYIALSGKHSVSMAKGHHSGMAKRLSKYKDPDPTERPLDSSMTTGIIAPMTQTSTHSSSDSESERDIDEEAYHNWVRSQPNPSEMHKDALRRKGLPWRCDSSCSDSETQARVAEYDEWLNSEHGPQKTQSIGAAITASVSGPDVRQRPASSKARRRSKQRQLLDVEPDFSDSDADPKHSKKFNATFSAEHMPTKAYPTSSVDPGEYSSGSDAESRKAEADIL